MRLQTHRAVAEGCRPPRPSLRRRVLRRPPCKIPVGPSLAATGAPGDVTSSDRPHWSISIVAGYLNYKSSGRRAARSSRHLGSALLLLAAPAPRVGHQGPAQPRSGGRRARCAADDPDRSRDAGHLKTVGSRGGLSPALAASGRPRECQPRETGASPADTGAGGAEGRERAGTRAAAEAQDSEGKRARESVGEPGGSGAGFSSREGQKAR